MVINYFAVTISQRISNKLILNQMNQSALRTDPRAIRNKNAREDAMVIRNEEAEVKAGAVDQDGIRDDKNNKINMVLIL